MTIQEFFDPNTFTFTYVLFDKSSKDAVLIDPVLDYNPIGSSTALESANKVYDFIRKEELNVHYILETHAHADHLSSSQFFKQRLPNAKLAIGQHITKVQDVFANIFDMGSDFPTNGSQFDVLLKGGETYSAGTLEFSVEHTPGHTPACSIYNFGGKVFVGDLIFQPDIGVGRCDFPAGSAEDLYNSVQSKIYTLSDDTELYVGHDYPPTGVEPRPMLTVAKAKETNVDLPASRSKDDFVAYRTNADSTLPAPKLLYPSVQVNIAAGHLPPKGANGIRLLHIPISEPKE